jgi:hypothetical protein
VSENVFAGAEYSETVVVCPGYTNIHAQYWSGIAEAFLNINIYDKPEPTVAAARKAIRGYRKAYPAGTGTTEFRILIESMQRTTIDVDYPQEA